MKSSFPKASSASAESPNAGSIPKMITPERHPINSANIASFFQNANTNVIVNGTNDNIPMFVASGIFLPPCKIRPMRLLQFPLLLL